MNTTKPDCYKCAWRDKVIGSAHSSCKFPKALEILAISEFSEITVTLDDGTTAPLISGDKYGIKSGWFFWPFDFDPTWLKTCFLFKEKENTQHG